MDNIRVFPKQPLTYYVEAASCRFGKYGAGANVQIRNDYYRKIYNLLRQVCGW